MPEHRFPSRPIVLSGAAILLLSLASTALAQTPRELEPTYSSSYNTRGPYPNRWQAEQDIWNAAGWPGSELAIPTTTTAQPDGSSTAYQVIPEYVPKSPLFSPLFYQAGILQNVPCSDCPITDQFGINRCPDYVPPGGLSNTGRCVDGSAIYTAIDNQFGNGSYCSYSIIGESPYTFQEYNLGPPLADGTQTYEVEHRKSVQVEAYKKNLGYCFNPIFEAWDIGLESLSVRQCPTGYYDGGTTGPDGVSSCSNHFFAWLYEYNPVEFGQNCPTGNPCYPTTGAKSLSETDYASPTLELTRAWNSFARYPDFAAMGRGWTHTYSQRILRYAGTTPATQKFLDEAGAVEYFDCTDEPTCSVYRSRKNAGWVLKPDGDGGWELYTPAGEQRLFDGSGRLTRIERRGAVYARITVSYDGEGRVDQVTDLSGRSLVFNYDTDGLVGSVTLPSGDHILYEYEQPPSIPAHVTWQQRLVKVTREDLSERVYHYEDRYPDTSPRFEFLITGITDENAVRYATYAYDDHARVVSSEHANGAGLITLNYTKRAGESESWTITEVTEALGEVKTYAMRADPFRKPTAIGDSRGEVTINYDPTTTWRSDRTDRAGNQTTYAYSDGLHETIRTEATGTPEQRVIETDWDTGLNRITERREPGKTTAYTYNNRGQVLTRTETDTATLATRTWTHTYFEAPSIPELIGQLATTDGPRTDVTDATVYAYYTGDDPGGAYLKGDLHTITNALGHATEYLEYDDNGRPLQVRDANNVVTTMTYHPRGWISTRTTDGQTTSFSYDDVGNLTRVTQADGSYIDYEYDAAHRMNAMADSDNNRIEYTLDAAGNRTAEKTYNNLGTLSRQMGRVFDQLSRLQKVIDGNLNETLYGYDDNGNRTSSQDPNLNSTSFEYDPLDRLVRTIDAVLNDTLMDYDERDNLVSVTDPLGNVTRYVYDGLDNQTRLDSPDTGITTYEYDAAGNRTTTTDARGVRVEYGYDALNRLTSVAYPDKNLNVRFTYDAGANGKGRLSSMDDAAGTESYTYDARGNVVSVSRDIDGTRYTTGYSYNGADRLTRIAYPSGMVIDYALDATGRIVGVDRTIDSVTDNLVTEVVYEPFGPVSDFTYGNGLSMSASFDQDYELERLRSGASLDWVFDHDPAGNILSIDDQASPGNSQAFTYDDLYRLDTATGGYGAEDFDYDANGNRARYQDGIVDDAYSYEPQSNRLATQYGWTFNRDAVGNRTQKSSGTAYSEVSLYGADNRLASFFKQYSQGSPPSLLTEYTYDGRGQRVSKSGGTATHYVYGLNGELLGEYVADPDQDFTEYVYLNGQPAALHRLRSELVVPQPQELIIDNGDAGTGHNGQWQLKTDPQMYGPDYLEAKKKASNTYTWAAIPPGIDYSVYAWWVASRSYTDNVEFTIGNGSGQTATVYQNQKLNGGRWNLLGQYTAGSGPHFVEVNAADGKTSADAIRLVYQPEPYFDSVATTAFVHTDHLGTPRAVSDASQTIVWRWDSRPFGDSGPDEDPDGDSIDFVLNLRFPGQYYDAESGLHYNYFRTYDPEIGRYVESDPIGLKGGMNTFSYTQANPILHADRFGLWVKRCARKLGNKHNPPKQPAGNPLRHDYLSVSGKVMSFGPKGNVIWSKGRVDSNENPENPQCKMICDDDRFDQYVVTAAEHVGLPNYCILAVPWSTPWMLGARNCQTWADDVLRQAKNHYLQSEPCPRCWR